MRSRLTTTLDALIRGRTLFGWNQYPDEVVELLFRCLQRNGIGSVKIFDGLNDHPQRKAWCGGDQSGTPDGPTLHSVLIALARLTIPQLRRNTDAANVMNVGDALDQVAQRLTALI